MSTYSANDIIKKAMIKARIISPGESVPSGKAQQVYEDLLDMLESWSLEKLSVVADVLEDFSLTAGKSEYTYGSGGDFDSERPVEIKDESYIREGSSDYHVRLLTLDVYRKQGTKSTTGRPRIISYSSEYPLGKIFLYPTPSNTDSIHLRVAKGVTTFTDKTTGISFAPGYSRAIIANLAAEISPSFGKKVSNELAFLAAHTMSIIKRANVVPVKSLTNPGLTRMAGGGSSGSSYL